MYSIEIQIKIRIGVEWNEWFTELLVETGNVYQVWESMCVGGVYIHTDEGACKKSDIKLVEQKKATIVNMNIEFSFIHPY